MARKKNTYRLRKRLDYRVQLAKVANTHASYSSTGSAHAASVGHFHLPCRFKAVGVVVVVLVGLRIEDLLVHQVRLAERCTLGRVDRDGACKALQSRRGVGGEYKGSMIEAAMAME